MLRVLAIPTNIFEVPKDFLPPQAQLPVFALATQGIVALSNLGKKGPSDPRPITANDLLKGPKDDVTSSTTPREEPFNEYVVSGNPPLLVRTRTILLKVEVLKNRTNAFGDPAIWVNHDTSHSVSEYKEGELLSP
jgi:hypothetical protein